MQDAIITWIPVRDALATCGKFEGEKTKDPCKHLAERSSWLFSLAEGEAWIKKGDLVKT